MLSLATALSGEAWACTAQTVDLVRQMACCGAMVSAGRGGFRDPAGPRIRHGVGLLPLVGVTTARRTLLTTYVGGVALEEYGQQFDRLVRDDDVSAIVLEIDSPGGEYFGLQELAAKIFQARGSKRIIAVVNALAGSGAYWIASAADEVVITPSGDAGSIGVLAVHVDRSGANGKAGIRPTYITAGRHKAEGSPDRPLSDEARAEMQRRVDERGRVFVEAVARYRGRSPAHVAHRFGQGRLLNANDAVARGLADRIGTLEEVLNDLRVPDRPRADRSVASRRGRLDVHQRSLRLAALRAPGGMMECPQRLGTIEGVACPYNATSLDTVCRFAPGAFTQSLARGLNVVLVRGHDGAYVFAQTADGSMRIWEDRHGLRYEARLPDNAQGRVFRMGIRSGRLSGVSVKYRSTQSSFVLVDGQRVELVQSAELVHLALCDNPAMPGTTVGIQEARP